uniref:Repressor of RNA polymerase III transcription MAF1 n=1 Tax=Phallusia mammillata TaxID=59560 RepID=A0A6F9DJE7_9ASCI|nr:repressor of RNA polymerase III transcription MAF1 homolog [Phallusia mammillata]
MKFLENSKLEALNSALTFDNGECQVVGRVESYSCKMAGEDKRLFKALSNDGQINDLAVLSPPQTMLSVSPGTVLSRSYSSADEMESPLGSTCSRKTLYYLISTLNASFRPDYDFSNAKSDEFSREPSVEYARTFINSTLGAVLGERYNRLSSMLWSTMDEEINFADCDVYSYNPDLDSDPYGDDGCLWSFNFFLYNRKMKRIIFFTCKAESLSLSPFREDDSGFLGTEMDDVEFESDMVHSYPVMVP